MRKLVLFDLDKTLNGSKARVKFIPEDTKVNANWLPWHKAFRGERMNLPLILTAAAYKAAGYDVAVVSNRDSSLTMDTRSYLQHAGFPLARYFLRDIDDNRTTRMWKVATINSILAYAEPMEVHLFDDDKGVLQDLREQYAFNKEILFIPHLVEFNY